MKDKLDYTVFPHPELLQVLAEIAARLTACYFSVKRCLVPYSRYSFEDYCIIIQSINRQVKSGTFDLKPLSISLIKMQVNKLLSIISRIDPDQGPDYFDVHFELTECYTKLLALYQSLTESDHVIEQ
jgi:hypothetical protein